MHINNKNFKEQHEWELDNNRILKLYGSKHEETDKENFHQLPIKENYQFYGDLYTLVLHKNVIIDLDIENFEFVIVGNSHAQMYIPSLEPYFKKFSKKALLLPMTGCLPTMDVNISKECMNKSKEYFNK